jgi:hypothetical protein
MSFFIVVIVHLSSSNLLGGFLFFTICCRHTIPISVELSLAATPPFSCVTQVTGAPLFSGFTSFLLATLLLYFSFPFYVCFLQINSFCFFFEILGIY